jgi:hypothetical protein
MGAGLWLQRCDEDFYGRDDRISTEFHSRLSIEMRDALCARDRRSLAFELACYNRVVLADLEFKP